MPPSAPLNSPFRQSPHQYSFGPLDMPYATNASFDPLAPTPTLYSASTAYGSFTSPPGSLPNLGFGARTAAGPPMPTSQDLVHSSYPAQLPPPLLLDHLLELFFDKVPFGDRLVHRPSFMASIRQNPPNSPAYPSSSLLHAICAIASVYSPIIRHHLQSSRAEPHRSWFEYFTHADEIELEAGGGPSGIGNAGASQSRSPPNLTPEESAERRRGIFGTEQASIGRVLALFDLRTGKRVLDTVRSMICLIWYYVSSLLFQVFFSCYFGLI